MLLFFQNIGHFLLAFKYFVLFIGVIIEGPFLMIASGFFIHTGFFALVPAFIAILMGDLVGDVVWYGLGYYIAGPVLKKRGHFLSVTPEQFEKAKELFKKYHVKILFISKITIGFGMALATLVVAGVTRISFKKYMTLNFIGEFILVTMMLTIGYFFGQAYASIGPAFKKVFLISGGTFFIILVYLFTRFMKRTIAERL